MGLLEAIVAITVALITTVGSTVVAFVKLRKENTAQHAEGRDLVLMVARSVESVGGKVDEIHGEVHGLQTWRATHTEYHRLTDPPVAPGVGPGCPDDETPRSA